MIELILLYVLSGQLKLDRIPFDSPEACIKAAPTIIKQQEADPRFNGGLFVGCVKLPNDRKS